MSRPDTSEYAPYYQRYILKAPEGDIIKILTRQMKETQQFFQRIPPGKEEFRYAPGKWSIKEVLGHVTDTERVFAYRALRFSRNDKTPLPSFEENDFVSEGNFSRRSLKDIAEELRLVRLSNIALFASFDEELMMRRGAASGFEFTVRAVLYIIAGHELHHRQILQERYL